MKTRWMICVGLICGTASLMAVSLIFAAEPAAEKAAGQEASSTESSAEEQADPAAVAAARARATVMYDVYSASLHMMHQRYFHGDKAVVPARALEDVFSDIRRQSRTEARWISVNMKPMNIDHEPETRFEKEAAREIAKGKETLEVVEDGYYRLAGTIPLTSGCVNCHGGFFRTQNKIPRFAGLVISVPLHEEEKEKQDE
ncbi:MAG: DUF3365 domain-containing protein [Planctomycetaceae bacterium]|nr:DUF3365 domain-containing protein [Planctomycetaceae bacterium]